MRLKLTKPLRGRKLNFVEAKGGVEAIAKLKKLIESDC
jgi:hypothetical protein